MNFPTVSDNAKYQSLRQDGVRLNQQMLRLTGELSSGQQADLGRATGGDFSMLAHVTRSIRLQEAFAQSITNAEIDGEVRQVALGKVAGEIDGYGPTLLGFATSGSMQNIDLALATAPERLKVAMASLNVRVADRSLFSGDTPDEPALVSGEEMLQQLRDVLQPLLPIDGATLVAEVKNWFNPTVLAPPPAPSFENDAWLGGDGAPTPAVLGETQQEVTGVTARDPALRDVLEGLALAALAAEDFGQMPDVDRREIVTEAAFKMQQGGDALILLRADLGASQARIEEARVASESARASLEIERGRLTEADPYRTATDLQAVQSRLEQLYILTARLSKLNLSEYLR